MRLFKTKITSPCQKGALRVPFLNMGHEAGKKAAGEKAAEAIQSGMNVGIGTGSTVFYFIEKLAERCQNGLSIAAVASSENSYKLAKERNIPLLPLDEVTTLDITVDGADEIDKQKRMIKGGGGALLREKIVAASSREMIVIVDESKVSDGIGHAKLPLEIIPFCHKATIHKIKANGFQGELRLTSEKTPFITDGGHYIYDIAAEKPFDDPAKIHRNLLLIPGVIETGLFLHLAGRVMIGKENGEVEIWQ